MSLNLDDSQLELLAHLAEQEADRLEHEADYKARSRNRWSQAHAESLHERAVHARVTLAALKREIDARKPAEPTQPEPEA